jgi:hypothetical protein
MALGAQVAMENEPSTVALRALFQVLLPPAPTLRFVARSYFAAILWQPLFMPDFDSTSL